MFTGNTETRISATYQDGDNNIDLVVDDMTADTNTNQLTTFVVEDGDGTEVTISQDKEWKFVEGTGIDIDWTDTSNGSDADPYDLTITCDLEGTELKSTGEGGGSKFLREDGDGTCSWQTISAGASALNDLSDVTYSSGDLTISSLDKIISGSLEFDSSGHIKFDGCAAGFTRHEETFSTTDLKSTGGTDDTDIDFRVSNKIRLEMTGDIAQMNLVFPAVSGNFTMVCTTNGDHDVTAWKVWESDLSAATTTDVMWAGGSVPAFTNNGIDIVSFYWDATEQQCYGVCSLAFATP